MLKAAAVQTKFESMRNDLRSVLIEREQEIDLILTAIIAGEHVLLVGPPGCGKSQLADAVVEWIHGQKYNVLLQRFTTTEEVFGPLDLQALKAGKYERITAGMLPEAHIGFLDEIFNASSVVLNTLLKILNERTFQNGTTTVKCPLELCVAASNQWPNSQEGGKELNALFDRFLFRKEVRPIATARGLDKLLWTDDLNVTLSTNLSVAEIAVARTEAASLAWSDEAKEAYAQIITALKSEGIVPGDRRLRKSINAAKAFAYLNGETEVSPDSLEIMSHVLWEDPMEQPKTCAKVVSKHANPAGLAINNLLGEFTEVLSNCKTKDMGEVVAASKKMNEIIKKLAKIDGHDKKGSKAHEAYEHAVAEHKAFKVRMLENA